MDDIEAFVAVVDAGSQTAAARRLGRSLQSVNRALTALERSVGVELIRRTTRRSFPTEAGQAFYRRVKPALAEIGEARLEAANRRAEPSGLLRIGAPVQFASAHVVPVVARFIAHYPSIEVELRTSDRPVDLLGAELDLAVRIRTLPDSSLKARRLGAIRTVTYGAPAYLADAGRPDHPDELTHHRCVLHGTGGGDVPAWRFQSGRRRIMVRVSGAFSTDDTAAARSAVLHGLGIGHGPYWQIREFVEQGRLELLLEHFEPPSLPIHAVFPPSGLAPAKTRLFVDLLATHLKHQNF